MSTFSISAVSELALVFFEAMSLTVNNSMLEKLRDIISDDETYKQVKDLIVKEFSGSKNKLIMEAEDNVNSRLNSNRQSSTSSTSSTSKVRNVSDKSEFKDLKCDSIPKTINGRKNDQQDPCAHAVVIVIDGHPRCFHHKKYPTTPSVTSAKDVKKHLKATSKSKPKGKVNKDSDSETESEPEEPPKKTTKKKQAKTTTSHRKKVESDSSSSDSTRNKKTSSTDAKNDIDKRKSSVSSNKKVQKVEDSETGSEPDDEVPQQRRFEAKIDNKKHMVPPSKSSPTKGKKKYEDTDSDTESNPTISKDSDEE